MLKPIATSESVDLRVVMALWRIHWERFARFIKIHITWVFIEPAIVLLAGAIGIHRLVGTVEGDIPYSVFVTPGIIMGQAMFVGLLETSWNAYNRITNNVYETQLTAPVTVFEITLGDICWAVTRAALSVTSLTLFALAFGWFQSWWVLGLIIPGIMAGALFGAMGYLFSTTVPYVSFLTLVFTLVATPMFLFSGTFFPLSVLPEWAQVLASILPLKPLVDIARSMTIGQFEVGLIWDFLYVIVLTVVLWAIAVPMLKRRLSR